MQKLLQEIHEINVALLRAFDVWTCKHIAYYPGDAGVINEERSSISNYFESEYQACAKLKHVDDDKSFILSHMRKVIDRIDPFKLDVKYKKDKPIPLKRTWAN